MAASLACVMAASGQRAVARIVSRVFLSSAPVIARIARDSAMHTRVAFAINHISRDKGGHSVLITADGESRTPDMSLADILLPTSPSTSANPPCAPTLSHTAAALLQLVLLMTGKSKHNGKNKRHIKPANHGARPCNHTARRAKVPRRCRYKG